MIQGYFDRIVGREVCGWAWNPEQPHQPVDINVMLDGTVVCHGVANNHRPDLLAAGIGNGNHAFQVKLPEHLTDGRTGTLTVTAGSSNVTLPGTPTRITLPNNQFRPVGPPANRPPHELAICAIVRNEGPYLLEWIAHHRLVGVEHFVLFDNESTDGTSAMLRGLAAAGVIDYVPWPDIPYVPAQTASYIAGLARLADRYRWVAFIDADEFLNPICGRDIPSILAEYASAAGLVVPWRLYGSSGLVEQGTDLVTRRFTRRAPADHPLNQSVKTIVQARLVARPEVHAPSITEGNLVDEYWRTAGSQGQPSHHPVPDAAKLVLNHYFTKSRQEWTVKRARGQATEANTSIARVRPEHHFAAHDLNDVEDLGLALQHDAIRCEMDRLLALLDVAATA